jgi:GcrA cell cycle regulator
MSWTDERVATLTKLWADGLSASQIAAELGGVTRNAVIGKVHRLGLSGRAKSASSAPKRAKQAPRTGSFNSAPRAKSGTKERTVPTSLPSRKKVEDIAEPECKKLSLVELTEKTCRWPHGDPATDEFHFCGHGVKDDSPYCEYHSRMAYQPTADRRKVKQVA